MKLRHLSASLAAAVAVAAPVAGCGSDNSQTAQGATKSSPSSSQPAAGGGAQAVTIDNFKFMPASLTVSDGARVTVTNDDSTAHTATADNGSSFDTRNIDPGASATITLSKPGTYKYHCSIHPFMQATLVVK